MRAAFCNTSNATCHVRFGSKADISVRPRHVALQINHVAEFGRLLHRQLGRFLATENAVQVRRGCAELRDHIRTVTDQTAEFGEGLGAAAAIDRRQLMFGHQLHHLLKIVANESIGIEDHAAISAEMRQDRLELSRICYWVDVDLYARLARRGLGGLI